MASTSVPESMNRSKSVSLNPVLIKSGLLSLDKDVPVTIPINGLDETITVRTFQFTKMNNHTNKIETFKGYVRASELIRELDSIRIEIQRKNKSIHPERDLDVRCAVGLVHCRSFPFKKGSLASGCIIPKLPENSSHKENSEQWILVRGHGKLMYDHIPNTNIHFKNVHFRVGPGYRARQLEDKGDIAQQYANWIMCSIQHPKDYSNMKSDDLIKVEHIDLMDMSGVCNPKLDREGSFSKHSAKVLEGMNESKTMRSNRPHPYKGGSTRKRVKRRRRKTKTRRR